MHPVQVDEPLAGEAPDPEKKRQHGARRVFGKAAGDVEIGLLDDVRRVETAGKPMVQAKPDHPLESIAVSRKELGQRRVFAGLGSVK
jgi:hypothetical protein